MKNNKIIQAKLMKEFGIQYQLKHKNQNHQDHAIKSLKTKTSLRNIDPKTTPKLPDIANMLVLDFPKNSRGSKEMKKRTNFLSNNNEN